MKILIGILFVLTIWQVTDAQTRNDIYQFYNERIKQAISEIDTIYKTIETRYKLQKNNVTEILYKQKSAAQELFLESLSNLKAQELSAMHLKLNRADRIQMCLDEVKQTELRIYNETETAESECHLHVYNYNLISDKMIKALNEELYKLSSNVSATINCQMTENFIDCFQSELFGRISLEIQQMALKVNVTLDFLDSQVQGLFFKDLDQCYRILKTNIRNDMSRAINTFSECVRHIY